jgi:membrane associated rhomboid family serine protease
MITTSIIVITALISIVAFSNIKVMNALLLSPYQIIHGKEWHRIITHAFVHANFIHLLVNMLVFLSFGLAVQNIFEQLHQAEIIKNPNFHFMTLYFGGIIISCLTTIRKHRNNFYYQGVGASGAVSAVVFVSIFFRPLDNLYLMAIIPIPAIVFGIGYLVYSHYMSRKSLENINHNAHFAGAVYGFVYPLLIDPKLFFVFLDGLIP